MWLFIRSNTLLHCNFLFCIFLLYRTDLQVEVQIRILLKDKYEIVSKMQTPAITLWFPGKCQSHFFIIEKQHINLCIKRFQHSICISLIWTKTNTEISFSFWLTLFYSISSDLRYFLKNIKTFYSLTVAIVSQKYRELSMQVENCE
jgi:hypothetical protein